MKHLILSLTIIFLFSCNQEKREFKKAEFHSGTMKVIRKLSGSIISEEIYDIRLKLSDDKFYRVDEYGNEGCFGALDWSRNKLNFISDECACFCDCNPVIDCMGDLILGEFNITFQSDNKFEFENIQVLSSMNGQPFDEWERYIVLEKE